MGTLKVGSNGSTINSIQFGQTAITSVAGGQLGGTITFPNAFSSTPIIIVSIQCIAGASNLDYLIVQSYASTSTNFQYNVRNIGGGASSAGNTIFVSWYAMV